MARKNAMKVSVNTWKKVIATTKPPVKNIKWHDITIRVKESLSIEDMLSFVNTTVDSCFDNETGEYLSYMQDFVIKSLVLEKYANFAMPQNIDDRYSLVYDTDAVSVVMNNINMMQFAAITNAIQKKIDYMVTSNAAMLNKQFNEMMKIFESLQPQIESILSTIGNDSFKKLLSNENILSLVSDKTVANYISEMQKNS